jgi:hypothetical protein
MVAKYGRTVQLILQILFFLLKISEKISLMIFHDIIDLLALDIDNFIHLLFWNGIPTTFSGNISLTFCEIPTIGLGQILVLWHTDLPQDLLHCCKELLYINLYDSVYEDYF